MKKKNMYIIGPIVIISILASVFLFTGNNNSKIDIAESTSFNLLLKN